MQVSAAGWAGSAMSGLVISNAQVFYDKSVEAVRDISLSVEPGKIVCLLGANGAGKSTLMKAISRILYPEKGHLTSGTILYRGRDLSHAGSDDVVREGIVLVPEGRRLFIDLTVEENILMGGFHCSRSQRKERLEKVYNLFPDLAAYRRRVAGYLSGGQQQMVAIGRALMSGPSLLMLDEPTLGLAPRIAQEIFAAIGTLSRETSLSVLVVEQNASLALNLADYGYVVEQGRVVFDGTREQLLNSPEIREFYLGIDGTSSTGSMRDVKHYKRRKRWLS